MSAGAGISRHRSFSSHQKSAQPPSVPQKGKQPAIETPFEPCAATASLLLFAQGSVVICCHHDTLAVERRFHKHAENIQFICVDIVSERGQGRLVVTYDVGQTAIVWDLFTGEQVARFASFEPLTVASWMRNGNIAFGNAKGEVILFEPSTSEHVSARTIYDPITALAPSHDCKTYAIGYHNGSILLAALQPSFTILHTLSTSRGPSPIAGLTWHASSSKQKSDMLATQTSDGDTRVWSVAKMPTSDAPRVIRVLKRADNFTPGRHWIAWSKNGRVVQFSDGETWSWDVRTKNVTYEPVPTVEHVRAICAYGPTATLFTLGPNHSIQQYELEQPQIVANIQHLPLTVPPTPPEDNKQLGFSTSESEEDLFSPIDRATYEVRHLESARHERNQADSPRSQRSLTDSQSSRASSNRIRFNEVTSPGIKTERTTTVFSTGTQSQLANGHPQYQASIQSPVSTRSTGHRKASRLRQEVLPSPESQVLLDLFPYTRARLSDMPYKPMRNPIDEAHMTPDDLRKQMLSVVFGWDEDVRDLVRDELSRHPMGSQSAILLSKWLDDDPDHMTSMLSKSGQPSALDWMMLALSGMGNQAQTKKMGQAFVEKMLSNGDIHAAATTLLSLGDRNDAIEVYVSNNYFLEAVLLTCLLMPTDWQRQSFLVRKWGEHVVENSQQHLAIRCFSCTGVEPTDPWTSPSAQQAARYEPSMPMQPMSARFAETPAEAPPQPLDTTQQRSRRFLEAPTPIAMPAPPMPLKAVGPSNRVTAKNAALKLITSFGNQQEKSFRFPGLKSDDRTPTNAPGVTPIAESAVAYSAMSPGGLGSYRMNNIRSLNSAMSARVATPGGSHRQRLPSIGETPIDVTPPVFPTFPPPMRLPTPADSSSEKDKEKATENGGLRIDTNQDATQTSTDGPSMLLSSARYEPAETPVRQTPLTAVAPPTAIKFQPPEQPQIHSTLTYDALSERPGSRTGSRSRKPGGLSIQMVQVQEQGNGDDAEEPMSYGRVLRRPDTAGSYSTTQFDTHSDMTSPLTTGNSYRSLKSPSVSGRSLDQYVSSLEQAQYYTKHQRARAPGPQDKHESSERKKSRHRRQAAEEERSRNARRAIPASKRSPSSPVPMSPEDLRLYTASVESFESVYASQEASAPASKPKKSQARSHSRNDDGARHRSRSRHVDGRSKPTSHTTSRRASPDPSADHYQRGRSRSKMDGPTLRSPSSPRPMSPAGVDMPKLSEADAALRFVSKDRSMPHRSSSRRHDRGTSARRDASPDRRKQSARSRSRHTSDRDGHLSRKSSRGERRTRRRHRDESSDSRVRGQAEAEYRPSNTFAHASGLDPELRPASANPQFLGDRKKKELAAAELEARRMSLARRPSAPAIPLPGQTKLHEKSSSLGAAPPLLQRAQTDISPRVPTVHSFAGRVHATNSNSPDPNSDSSSGKEKTRPRLPGTPRAMRHPLHSQDPNVPDIPDNMMPLLLSSDVYRPPHNDDLLRRSTSAPPLPDSYVPSNMVPVDLPKHPAFDHRIANSRSSSKDGRGFSRSRSRGGLASREMSRDREMSHDRDPEPRFNHTEITLPPILPELQHLATPPPPPPPPSAPYGLGVATNGAMTTGEGTHHLPKTAPLPQSAFDGDDKPHAHKRGRSGHDKEKEGFMVGKMRSIAERMRSSSRGKDSRSPRDDERDERLSPYESLPPLVVKS